ncbi:pectate lyase [Cellulophaga sp. F20128]|uniref:pectate lyase n=1 Tax=Cellulophaga sp. F20128 TaxID=2926413 RepID=UPI001FF621BE|nr:pectate lyase [Cellulophaga sp. F20128]MCK0158303.1 pectate lyase [Cellulophaga sp. F20128]
MKKTNLILLFTLIISITITNAQNTPSDYLQKSWKDVAIKMPSDWYGTSEAKLVAENVLLAQKEIGGWEKNKSFHQKFTEKEKLNYANNTSKIGATFDNNATITELLFLAKVYSHTKDERYKNAFNKGLNYIIISQYKNGGWPQFFPVRTGSTSYSAHITYNDNAMVNIMKFLKTVFLESSEIASLQINKTTIEKTQKAFKKGIECFLKTQIIVKGTPTVWCAQHDKNTLAPAMARSYELASFSGAESVNIVLLLMEEKNPSKEIIASINRAVTWFRTHKVEGIRIETEIQKDGLKNRIVVEDKNAPSLWGRFYDLKTEKPFFCDRDGIKKNSLAEIGYNRRNGYSWYTNAPIKIFSKYDEWKQRIATK